MTEEGTTILIERYKETGNQQAFEVILDRCRGRLIALAKSRLGPKFVRRIEPQEIADTAFRTTLRRVRDGELNVKGSGDLWRLLSKIAVRELIKQIAYHSAGKRDVRSEEHTAEEHDLIRSNSGESDVGETVALKEILDKVLDGMKEDHRWIVLAYLAGWPKEEISEKIKLTVARINQILRNFKSRMSGYDDNL